MICQAKSNFCAEQGPLKKTAGKLSQCVSSIASVLRRASKSLRICHAYTDSSIAFTHCIPAIAAENPDCTDSFPAASKRVNTLGATEKIKYPVSNSTCKPAKFQTGSALLFSSCKQANKGLHTPTVVAGCSWRVSGKEPLLVFPC